MRQPGINLVKFGLQPSLSALLMFALKQIVASHKDAILNAKFGKVQIGAYPKCTT